MQQMPTRKKMLILSVRMRLEKKICW